MDEKIALGISLIFSSLFVYSKDKAVNLKSPEKDKNVKPRNIIFILTDDHRQHFMGFTGKIPWLENPSEKE